MSKPILIQDDQDYVCSRCTRPALDSLPYTPLHEAVAFLELYLEQGHAYLNELKVMQKMMRHPFGQHYRSLEKEASVYFEKLFSDIKDFMAESKGIRFP